MANIYVGSARHDENGKIVNGVPGDQLQKSSTNDMVGEVSMQPMYTHSKGWYVLRLKNIDHANAAANKMKEACNNPALGYNQNDRYGVNRHGIGTKTKTACDCSSLVRQVIKEVTGKDAGDFNTSNEISKLKATGLFENEFSYVSQEKTPVYNGDVLVTKTKGHTVIVVEGNPRVKAPTPVSDIYEVQKGDTLSAIGRQFNIDWKTIAEVNGIKAPYEINVGQVLKLKKNATAPTPTSTPKAKTKVTYTSHRIPTNKWGNEIVGYNMTNSMGYSGSFGQEIDKVAIKLSEGTVTYTAHRAGKWGGEITGYSTTDTNNYAGSANKPIDAITIKASGINGTLKYRVHRKPDNKWGNWITGYSKTDTNNYAGSFGKAIDAIQIAIE